MMNISYQTSVRLFNRKSKNKKYMQLKDEYAIKRKKFLSKFSPAKLAKMRPGDLLEKVFGDSEDSMVEYLLYNHDFGGVGRYKYLSVLFINSEGWHLYENGKIKNLSLYEALEKATQIRNDLLNAVDTIKKIGKFESLQDYKSFYNSIKDTYYLSYNWVLKYFHIVFPTIFASVYRPQTTIKKITVDLNLNYSSNKYIANGIVALFIKQASIDPDVFGYIWRCIWMG